MTPAAKRTTAAAGGGLLLAVAQEPWHWAALTGWVAACGGVWLWRLKHHPMGPCRSCKGRPGRNVGSDRTQWGRCARCKKTPGNAGEEPRVGAAWLHPELRKK